MASSPVLLQGAGGALSGFTGLEGPARKTGGVVAGAMAQRDAQQFESDGGRGGGVDGWEQPPVAAAAPLTLVPLAGVLVSGVKPVNIFLLWAEQPRGATHTPTLW